MEIVESSQVSSSEESWKSKPVRRMYEISKVSGEYRRKHTRSHGRPFKRGEWWHDATGNYCERFFYY